MITRRFATYNFVCKRWNDACYTSIIPNVELYVEKFERPTQIESWLERVAIPPAGQIRQIRIHESTWKMIVRHLEDIVTSYRLCWFPQITHFATAFCRLGRIRYDMLPITGDFSYSTLENAIQLRELRWWPLLNTMKPHLADYNDFSKFLTEQRRIAGIVCPPTRQLHITCTERIDILPYKVSLFQLDMSCLRWLAVSPAYTGPYSDKTSDDFVRVRRRKRRYQALA